MKEICILLIDDDAGTNLLNSKIIHNAHVTDNIVVKLNAAEAMEYIRGSEGITVNPKRTIPHTLIFLDINMPVMDGWEFLESFATLSTVQQEGYRIVMLTTSFNLDDKIRAERNPFISRYLIKPLTPQAFENIVTKGVISWFP